ncbi:MAG: hypothetical protein ABW252_08150 [Polyangiales bacterium]
MQHTRCVALGLMTLVAQTFSASCSDAAEDCGHLDLAACARARGCQVSSGSLVDEAQQCLGGSAPVGCMASLTGRGCDDAIGYVRDRQGRAWKFGNLCLPEGLEQIQGERAWTHWESCAVPVATSDTPCAGLALGSCARAAHCTVVDARFVVQHRSCIDDVPSALACADRAQACAPGFGYGRDGQGLVWQFPNQCVPARFQVVTPTAQQPWSSWGFCSPL